MRRPRNGALRPATKVLNFEVSRRTNNKQMCCSRTCGIQNPLKYRRREGKMCHSLFNSKLDSWDEFMLIVAWTNRTCKINSAGGRTRTHRLSPICIVHISLCCFVWLWSIISVMYNIVGIIGVVDSDVPVTGFLPSVRYSLLCPLFFHRVPWSLIEIVTPVSLLFFLDVHYICVICAGWATIRIVIRSCPGQCRVIVCPHLPLMDTRGIA